MRAVPASTTLMEENGRQQGWDGGRDQVDRGFGRCM